MTDSVAPTQKPSSSVKLVLLGEAAVGKVRNLSTTDVCGRCSPYQTLTYHALEVLPRPPLREQ